MATFIRSVGSYVPAQRVTNDDLAARMDTSDEWIRSHTGIGARHLAAKDETASDMAFVSAKRALEKAGLAPADLSLIVFTTISPDFPGFPSTACVLQKKLGAANAVAFDITAACSGFIYGLSIADAMLPSLGGHALVVSAELLSSVVDWNDRNTCILFGDASGAAIVSLADSSSGASRILGSSLKAYGDTEALYMSKPDWNDPASPPKKPVMMMDGRLVYNFAVNENVKLISEICEKEKVSYDELAWIVPHQANARIIQAASKRLDIDESKFYMNMEEYANTSAASIPLALDEMDGKGLLKKGDLVILVGFGAGLTSGAALVRW